MFDDDKRDYNYSNHIHNAEVPIYTIESTNKETLYLSARMRDLVLNKEGEEEIEYFITRKPISMLLDSLTRKRNTVLKETIKQFRDLNKEHDEAVRTMNVYPSDVSTFIFACGKCGSWSPAFIVESNGYNTATDYCMYCQKEKFDKIAQHISKKFIKQANNVFN